MCPHQADGLLSVIDFIGARIVTVTAQTIAKNDSVDAEIVEKGNKVCALRANVQSIVPATRHENDRRAGVETALDGVHFNRRIVNVDNAVDSPRNSLAHVILLRLAALLRVEIRRTRWIEDHDHASREDRLRSIWRIRRGTRCGNSQR